MALSNQQVGNHILTKAYKGAAVRLSDDPRVGTLDYADVFVGDGVPSGAYGRASGTTLVYIRKDAPAPSDAVYVSHDGGTTWKPLSAGPVYANTAASSAVTGAQENETVFSTKHTFPANTLRAGQVIHAAGWGRHTATTGTETSMLAVKMGVVSITSDSSVDPANADIFAYDLWITVRSIGASGSIVAFGTKRLGASGSAPVAFVLAPTAIDTTQALDLGIVIDRQAGATDADSAQVEQWVVELKG